jgi:predicted nucleic acid-binding protein
MHSEAIRAIRVSIKKNERITIVPQNLYEFWVVATRPVSANGLGFRPRRTRHLLDKARRYFEVGLDLPGTLDEWLRLVDTYSILGVRAHDTRLVAAMKLHGISHLLTFNTVDFKAYHLKEITVISPSELLADKL